MYIITGATGHTGSIATKTLLARGHKVRAIGRSADRLKPLAEAGADPFVADITDARRLAEALRGAEAVYAMIPPNPSSNDFRGFQEQVTETLASAIHSAKVRFVVSLSSVGADKASGTGPVIGLYNLEQKLNRIADTNVLHLRAGYFMENTLAQVGAIKAMGKAGGPLRPDLKLSMIASRDIGVAAAEALIQLSFQGKQTRELLGQRDLTMTESATIIGNAIGKPGLSYFQMPDDQMRAAFVQFGMSTNFAGLILEMAGALNSGHMRALEPRSTKNTTPTSYEQFVAENFVPLFQNQATFA